MSEIVEACSLGGSEPEYCEVLPQGTYFPAEDLQTVLDLSGKEIRLVVPRNFVVFLVPAPRQEDGVVNDVVVSLMEGRHEVKRERLEKSGQKLLVRKLGQFSLFSSPFPPPNSPAM